MGNAEKVVEPSGLEVGAAPAHLTGWDPSPVVPAHGP